MEGSRGIVANGTSFGVRDGAVSKIFSHGMRAMHRAFKNIEDPLSPWSDREKRKAVHVLICGFPNVITFADGSKQRALRLGDAREQELMYDGHHCLHAYSFLVWCDVFGDTNARELV